MRVRGWKASFHRRGARLTEQARTLVVRSTMIDLNKIEEKTAKIPSLSKTGVQPPYLECIAAIQLACVAASEAIPAGTCANSVPASDNSPMTRISHSPVRIEMKNRQSRFRTSAPDPEGPARGASSPSSGGRELGSAGRVRVSWLM